MFNHDAEATPFHIDNREIRVIAHKDYAAGEEVFVNYGIQDGRSAVLAVRVR